MGAKRYCDHEASEKERSAIHWQQTVADRFNYNGDIHYERDMIALR